MASTFLLTKQITSDRPLVSALLHRGDVRNDTNIASTTQRLNGERPRIVLFEGAEHEKTQSF